VAFYCVDGHSIGFVNLFSRYRAFPPQFAWVIGGKRKGLGFSELRGCYENFGYEDSAH
jgi:hypothetical protein